MSELKNSIEAVLFATGKKIVIDEVMRIVGESNKSKVRKTIRQLITDYKNHPVLMIIEEGDNYKLTVREKYLPVVRSIIADTELTKAVMETLAVIAWRAPVLQSEVVDIRSASAYDHIGELVDLGFITKEKHARSYIIKLTTKFFDYFDLDGKEDIRDIFKEIKKKGPTQSKVDDFEAGKKSTAQNVDGLEVYDSAGSNLQESPKENNVGESGIEIYDSAESVSEPAVPVADAPKPAGRSDDSVETGDKTHDGNRQGMPEEGQENNDSEDDLQPADEVVEPSDIYDGEKEFQSDDNIEDFSSKDNEVNDNDDISVHVDNVGIDRKKQVENELFSEGGVGSKEASESDAVEDTAEDGADAPEKISSGKKEDIVRSEDDLDDDIVKEHDVNPELEKLIEEDETEAQEKKEEKSFDESLL